MSYDPSDTPQARDPMNLSYGFACQKRARHFGVVLRVFALSGVGASASTITTYTAGRTSPQRPPARTPTPQRSLRASPPATAALGSVSTIDFESAPRGSFSSLSVASGVTLTATDAFGNNQTIRDTSNSPTIPTLDGFNTTLGGANFLEMQGALRPLASLLRLSSSNLRYWRPELLYRFR